MIYFDNAATTFKKPPSVYRAVKKHLRECSGNPGRSSHKIAVKAAECVYCARESIAELFEFDHPERVTFTMNATYALNTAIKTMITKKCHVIISDVEHNSTLRPLLSLCNTLGVEYSVFNTRAQDLYSEIEGHIRPDTSAIISTLVSNVDGRTIPFFTLSEIKKKHNIKLIVDASQAAGHKLISLSDTSCDAIAMPGHKALFGIQGVGICIFPSEIPETTIIEGGSGYNSMSPIMPHELPEKFEAGTLPVPAIASLTAGVEFIQKHTLECIEDVICELTLAMIDRLCDIDGIEIIGADNGVVSFRHKMISSESFSLALDKYGICTRGGLHCAPLAHKTMGTSDTGTVRASFSYFNTEEEIDRFWRAASEISKKYKSDN